MKKLKPFVSTFKKKKPRLKKRLPDDKDFFAEENKQQETEVLRQYGVHTRRSYYNYGTDTEDERG